MSTGGETNSSLWLDLLGAEVRFRDVDGYRTRSIEAGSGEPVLLIHGLLGSADGWAETVMPLSADFRVIALDMLGHALTDKPDIEYTIAALVDHVVSFLDVVGIERAHIVGHSLGGLVAGRIAVHHPERVLSFTSVVGAGLPIVTRRPDTGAPGPTIAEVSQRAMADPTPENVLAQTARSTLEPPPLDSEIVALRTRFFNQPDMRATGPAMVRSFTAGLRADETLTAEQLGALTCPALIVWTEYNSLFSAEGAQASAALIPGGRFHCIPGSGHSPQREAPDELNAVLIDFLNDAGR